MGQMLRPRWTNASKIRYLKQSFPLWCYLTSSPSRISTTKRRSVSEVSALAKSTSYEIPTSATKASRALQPFRLIKQHWVMSGSSRQSLRMMSRLNILATTRRYRTPSVFQQTRQGEGLLGLRVKIYQHDCRVMETGCPPKKTCLFFILGKSSLNSLRRYQGRAHGYPGCYMEMGDCFPVQQQFPVFSASILAIIFSELADYLMEGKALCLIKNYLSRMDSVLWLWGEG